MIYVRIYKDQIQIYDSDYPKEDVSVSEIAAGNYPWESYYDLELSDITVEAVSYTHLRRYGSACHFSIK